MFKDKIILITGGSSGIGKATALLFAEQGADVAITYKNNREGAESVVQKVAKLGRRGISVQADLINEKDAKNVVTRTIEAFGRIDVLVNNAGRYVEGDEWDGTSEIWAQSLQQNLVSIMNVSKYAIEEFKKQQAGVMVSVSSRHGLSGVPDAISYGASKAGIINITQAYAKLLSPFGRANSVSPSATEAGYWHTAPKEELEETLANRPNRKLVDPKTVAEKILLLASDESRDITGQNFPVTE